MRTSLHLGVYAKATPSPRAFSFFVLKDSWPSFMRQQEITSLLVFLFLIVTLTLPISSLQMIASFFVRLSPKSVKSSSKFFRGMRMLQARKLTQINPRCFSARILVRIQRIQSLPFWGRCKTQGTPSILDSRLSLGDQKIRSSLFLRSGLGKN